MITVLTTTGNCEAALSLKKRFGIPVTDTITTTYWQLRFDNDVLCLHPPAYLKQTPFYLDFLSKNFLRRLNQFGKKQLLAKAVGVRVNNTPTPTLPLPGGGRQSAQPTFSGGGGKSDQLTPMKVVDATAGLGRDGLLLASLGCQVTLVERNPVVMALLEDAVKRAKDFSFQKEKESKNLRLDNVQLVFGEACEYLSSLEQAPDVIYLDPMFPPRTKSALVKKEMQILQAIANNDPQENHNLNAEKLLQCALQKNTKRVVVKRPKSGDALAGEPPNLNFPGKTHRFDVYIRP